MKNNNNDDTELLRKKLLYQSTHRGCKEMDILLGNFANKNLQNLNLDELKVYELLLTINDDFLYDLILSKINFKDMYFENKDMYKINIKTVKNLIHQIFKYIT